jgi:hypothetical protein
MDGEKSNRELLHELGNAQQEKVALQYLLGLAADQIEQLADGLDEGSEKQKALETAERLRRSAEL